MSSLSLFPVTAVFFLEHDTGLPLLSKYYPHDGRIAAPTSGTKLDLASQSHVRAAFERKLASRLARQSRDVATIDEYTVLYRVSLDITIAVVGPSNVNELILDSLVEGLHEAATELYKPSFDKRALLEKYELACLLINEAVDGGVVLETDGNELVARVGIHAGRSVPKRGSLGEEAGHAIEGQGLASAFQFAKDRVAQALLRH